MGPGLGLLGLLWMLLGAPLVPGAERRLRTPAAHFLAQGKSECRFANGTAGEVRYLQRYTWGGQECLRFDSRLGRFVAIAQLCKAEEERFNRDPQKLQYCRAQVDSLCRYNYAALGGFLHSRKIQPLVRISPTKAEPLAHHTLLLCTAAGYYPSEVVIKWLKNGQEQTEGVGYTDEVQNGDWTFLNQAMLETVPERGDVYACQVEHSSLTDPITVQWEPQTSDSAKSKVWTGALGALLGVAFVAVGLYLYLKNREASPLQPPAALIS